MNDAEVQVLDTDSTLLSTRVFCGEVTRGSKLYRYDTFVPRLDKYIVKVRKDGYDPVIKEVTILKSDDQKVVDVTLHKTAIQLDEVTVIGSKVMMVNRGDTVVYDASAFQLSNGSMLDALVRQLPGVELNGSRITVNGKFVSALLVNGRDFFRGDPKIALDNLPAYYVDKVKVYHQISRMRRVMEGDSVKMDENKDPLVMDVNLKRDYAEGWLGNADVAGGTHDKYLARLFGMRYTRHSGLFLFGNVNNLNDDRRANKSGNWAGRTSDEGTVKARSLGINFEGSDKSTGMEYGTSARLTVKDGDYEDIRSVDNYYSTGDIFRRSRSASGNKTTDINWDGKLDYPKTGRFYMNFMPSIAYNKTKNHSLAASAAFDGDPQDSYRGAAIDSLYAPVGSQRLTEMLINRRRQQSIGESDALKLNGSWRAGFRMLGMWVGLNARGEYDNSHNTLNLADNLSYNAKSSRQAEIQNKYQEMPSRSYMYQAGLTLPLIKYTSIKRLSVELGLDYQQKYSSGERQLFRLDQYEAYKNMPLGILPSTTDSLQAAIDMRNSYLTTNLARNHTATVTLRWQGLQLILPITLTDERISDHRNNNDAHLSRHKMHFDTQLSYGNRELQVTYKYSQVLPAMNHLLDVRDDSDPLRVSLGNAALGNSQSHRLDLFYRKMQTNRLQRVNLKYSLYFLPNAVSMSRTYDLATGITTTMPTNINGNWGTSLDLTFGQTVDKKRRLTLSSATTAGYMHSADYATIQKQGNNILSSDKNEVNSIKAGETLKAEYRIRDFHAAATAGLNWSHADSKAQGFYTVNALDYNYGIALTKRLAKNLDLDTEAMMWSRRGYTDRTMNDDELIWNASLSYAFGKLGQWIVKAEGRDLLRNQNSVRQTMNAQGRTETWYKTIPSYCMLHLMYQFKKAPKKRN